MLEEYRKQSFKYAEDIGLCSGFTKQYVKKHYGFICREGWARRVGAAVIKMLNEDIDVLQMGLYNGYDQEFNSGGTVIKMEIKCRSYDVPYRWAKISANENKSGLIDSGEGWILEYYDKLHRWWIWDLSKYTPVFEPNGYQHTKYTAESDNNYEVVEDAYLFDRRKATFTGKLY